MLNTLPDQFLGRKMSLLGFTIYFPYVGGATELLFLLTNYAEILLLWFTFRSKIVLFCSLNLHLKGYST